MAKYQQNLSALGTCGVGLDSVHITGDCVVVILVQICSSENIDREASYASYTIIWPSEAISVSGPGCTVTE